MIGITLSGKNVANAGLWRWTNLAIGDTIFSRVHGVAWTDLLVTRPSRVDTRAQLADRNKVR
ncbi:hypothetical protein SBA5_140053 [Candidatus Sulfotelmatomonas gaucii]|uniref:Uncharacterized protein n=1 Tax=Candidatus Sulfuritelmatomonas gaucii TaxID=2043161 RepID=A0A2N9L4E9_9BACT|nr:hypothetical protein SBA5_140053 [Candidatus Sulfotelmatomonas gaucii]